MMMKNHHKNITPKAKKITDLNDHCLEKIFEHLNFQSLFNVAIANEYQRPAAALMYKRRFRLFQVELIGNGYFLDPHPVFVMNKLIIDQLKSMLQFLRCFGSQITVLEMDIGFYVKNKRYELINQYVNKYCAENLVSIEFTSVLKISKGDFPKPFVNVETVEVVKR